MRRARLWISAVRPAVIRCRTLNGDAMTDVQLILTALKVSIIESIIAFFIVEMPVLIQGFARNCRWWTVQLIIHIYLLYIYGRYNTRHALITKMFQLWFQCHRLAGLIWNSRTSLDIKWLPTHAMPITVWCQSRMLPSSFRFTVSTVIGDNLILVWTYGCFQFWEHFSGSIC